jgi:RNA polymerase-binding transcription factor DksA
VPESEHASRSDGPLRARLEIERHRVAERVAELTREFDAIISASAEANLDDEHDPEGATVGFERAQVIALLEQARAHLADLDAALARDEVAGGRCAVCGEPIAPERLDALPAARLCVRCAGVASSRGRRASRR